MIPKSILHGRLSSHNIFLENKVKLSLLDYASSQLNLQYYAPELARQLGTLAPPKTREGDVFRFQSLTSIKGCHFDDTTPHFGVRC